MTRNLLLETTYQTPANPTPASRTPDNSDSTAERWQAYINGGAAADDVHYLQKTKEEEAKYLETIRNNPPALDTASISTKLIELSPEKKSASKNADLLIDLDVGTVTDVSQRQSGIKPLSYANAASSKEKNKVKTSFNLLD